MLGVKSLAMNKSEPPIFSADYRRRWAATAISSRRHRRRWPLYHSTVSRRFLPLTRVVMPAELERFDKRQSVCPGMVLKERDRTESGANQPILLVLPVSSKFKLRESARSGFDALVAKREGELAIPS